MWPKTCPSQTKLLSTCSPVASVPHVAISPFLPPPAPGYPSTWLAIYRLVTNYTPQSQVLTPNVSKPSIVLLWIWSVRWKFHHNWNKPTSSPQHVCVLWFLFNKIRQPMPALHSITPFFPFLVIIFIIFLFEIWNFRKISIYVYKFIIRINKAEIMLITKNIKLIYILR